MKTNIVIFLKLLLVVFIARHANAQQVTALHAAAGETVFYGAQSFVDAYDQAVDGDTLYLSGGSFTPPLLVDKGLIILGAGYHPEFTSATLPTQISANLNIGANASNLYMEGLLLSSSIQAVNTDGLSGVSIRRCRIEGSLNVQGTGSNSNFGVSECIIDGGVDIFALNNSSFANNFFGNRIVNGSGNLISNNLFFRASSSSSSDKVLFNIQNCTVVNNIFVASSNYHVTTTASVGNIFENNVFTTNNVAFGTAPILNNNYFNYAMDEVFVDFSAAPFSFDDDYHLQQPDVLPGNDGTQVGVYGGLFPLKEGGIPMNPHISNKNISGTTNASGQLEVEITVEAQEQ
jgi:hypothetical protein